MTFWHDLLMGTLVAQAWCRKEPVKTQAKDIKL